MKTRTILILLGLFSFLLFMIINFPASIAYQLSKNSIKGVEIYDLQGTVWSGRASSMRVNKQTFQDINWELRPLSLLKAMVSLDINVKDNQYPLKGRLAFAINGDLEANAIKGTLPAKMLQQVPPLSLVSLDGEVLIDMKTLVMNEKELKSAEGEILLAQTSLLQPVQAELGNIRMNLSNENDSVLIKIKDQQAPIGIDGTLIVKPEHKFSFNAVFKPTAKANNFLVGMLKNITRTKPDGSMVSKYEGVY